jgi:hypothetical protein
MPWLETVFDGLGALGFFTAAFGAWMIYRQHRYQILMDLHKELLSDQMQESIRITHSLSRECQEHPTKEQLIHIERVVGVYDLIGMRAKHRAISLKHLLASEWKVILPLWDKVQPFVKMQRTKRTCPSYKEFFGWLVERAEEYRRERHSDEHPKSFNPDEMIRTP